MNLAYLVQSEAISEEAAELLKLLVKAGYNIFYFRRGQVPERAILNALSEYTRGGACHYHRRFCRTSVEQYKNLVRLETRPANGQGTGN